MKFLRFAPVLVAIAPIYAASISVSTFCNPMTSQTDTGTSASCSGTEPDGSGGTSIAQAQASVSFSLLPDGFTVDDSAHAESLSGGDIGSASPNATAAASITDGFDTAGPVRPGYVEISFGEIEQTDGGPGSGTGVFSLGSVAGCEIGFTCQLFRPGLFKIELGEPLGLSMAVNAKGPCGDCGDADGSAWFNLTFQFFEADGTTPVAVSEINPVPTPEPATPLLITLGGLLVLGLAQRR